MSDRVNSSRSSDFQIGSVHLLYKSDEPEKVARNSKGHALPTATVQPNKAKAGKTHRRAKKARRTSRSKR